MRVKVLEKTFDSAAFDSAQAPEAPQTFPWAEPVEAQALESIQTIIPSYNQTINKISTSDYQKINP